MADLNVTIAEQDLRAGEPATSKLSIDIAASADVKYALYITIPATLVAAKDAESIVFNQDVEADPGQVASGTRWRIGSKSGTTIKAGKKLTLTLSKIRAVSKGDQTVTVEWSARNKTPGSQPLKVTVLALDESPKIISFKAERYVLPPSRSNEQVPVKLQWQTDKESTVELWRLGTKLLPKGGDPSAPQDQTTEWCLDSGYESSGIQPYQLIATAKGRTVSRWLFVRVQDAGWNKISCTQGAPTLLLNDGDNTLYGVFARDGEAGLYKLEPEKGALGRVDTFVCKVPPGMEQSPGVLFKNKIWLLGGSQIHPEKCSNQIWCFDPLNPPKNTNDTISAKWPARMGHACAVFDGKIWILGGMDEDGNTLRDVWWSADGWEWTEDKDTPLPIPVCLLTACAFDGRLWFYGGADAPFGAPQKELWYRASGSWQKVKSRNASGEFGGDPYGSALCIEQGLDGRLTALATLRRPDGIVSRILYLSGFDYDFNEADVEVPSYAMADKAWQTKGAGPQVPFRLSAVSFNNFIFAASLVPGGDVEDSPSLTYLVGSVSS